MPTPDSAAAVESAGAAEAGGELKDRAIGGFIWLSLGNAVRAVLKAAVLAVLARLLVPADFGLLAAAGVVVWFSTIFSNLGVGPALVQRRELTARHIATGLTTSVVLGIVAGAAMYLAAPLLADAFRMPALEPVLAVMALAFPIASVAVVAEALVQRELRFGTIAGCELISYTLGYGIVGIGAAWAGAGVWALVAAELTKTLAKAALYLWTTREPVRLGFDGRAFRELIGFGSGYTANGLSIYFATQGDNMVVGRFLGAGALGLYSRAYEIMTIPAQALGMMLDKILFPTLAAVQHDPVRLRLAYRRCTALVALSVLPLSVLTVALADQIVLVLLGPNWLGAVVPLQVLAAGMYCRVSYMVGGAVNSATGAVGQMAWRSGLYAGLVFVGALVGRYWGLPGVAAGVVIAVTVNFAMVLQLGLRMTGLRWRAALAAHRHAIALAALVGGEAWLLERVLAAPPAVVLLAALAAAVLTVLVLLRTLPPRVLGEDGLWMFDTLCGAVPESARPLVRRLLRP